MTTTQLIASAVTWTAAIAAVIAAALSWRSQQQARATLLAVRAERRTFTTPGRGYDDGIVCAAYRVARTAEDSGLCARCGMSDYKHQEASGA